mmetsp:Transcript_3737/g.13816  ORF Transcript_3737/g.13816 Transcript_3737/m.13816 type:complete len:236 (+) Transcript_3737:5557-6264(+)
MTTRPTSRTATTTLHLRHQRPQAVRLRGGSPTTLLVMRRWRHSRAIPLPQLHRLAHALPPHRRCRPSQRRAGRTTKWRTLGSKTSFATTSASRCGCWTALSERKRAFRHPRRVPRRRWRQGRHPQTRSGSVGRRTIGGARRRRRTCAAATWTRLLWLESAGHDCMYDYFTRSWHAHFDTAHLLHARYSAAGASTAVSSTSSPTFPTTVSPPAADASSSSRLSHRRITVENVFVTE